MEIVLTHAQWHLLVPIIQVAYRAESRLGIPLEIDNGDQRIEITSNEVKIILQDA